VGDGLERAHLEVARIPHEDATCNRAPPSGGHFRTRSAQAALHANTPDGTAMPRHKARKVLPDAGVAIRCSQHAGAPLAVTTRRCYKTDNSYYPS